MSVLTTERISAVEGDPEIAEVHNHFDWWWLVPVLISVFVFIQLDPKLLFANTTTAGGDTGAHFMVPYFVEHNLLPHLRITGWSPQWYDGYPILTFYFPLPSLLVALLNTVLSYGVAFKLVTVSGSLMLPFAVFALAKAGRLSSPLSAVLSIFSLEYLLNTSYTIDGGNIASTLAGEFSFSLSLSIGLFFVAVVMRGLSSRRRSVLAGVLYGLCALAHILPAIFVAAFALIYVLVRRDGREFLRLAIVGVIGIGVIAFWIVPFAAFLQYSSSMGWEKVTQYSLNLLPTTLRPWILLALVGVVWSIAKKSWFGITLSLGAVLSALAFIIMPNSAIYNARALPFWTLCIYLLAGIGAYGLVKSVVWAAQLALIGQKYSSGALLEDGLRGGVLDASSAGSYLAPPTQVGQSYSDDDIDDSYSHDVPSTVSGPPGIGTITGRSELIFRVLFTLLVAIIAVVGIAFPYFGTPQWAPVTKVSRSFLPDWVQWNYSGYEGKAAWPEYSAIMAAMKNVGTNYGCGRAMWEYNAEENAFGTPMALMLLPYWTNNCIDSMEGLFFESSATTPYHFLNQSELSAAPSDAMSGLPYAGLNVPLGVEHLQMLGVRYFMAYTPAVVSAANSDPNLKLIRQVGPAGPAASSIANTRVWNIYLVKNSAQVTPLKYLPAVLSPNSNSRVAWLNSSVAWYQNPAEWQVLRAASGPANWPRVSPKSVKAPEIPLPSNTVSAIKTTASTISFDVSRVGVPVYVKTSYFPNWKVQGASGPYRVSPNLMVVVPTTTHVRMYYGVSAVEKVSDLLTIGTLVIVVGLLILPLRPRRHRVPAVAVEQ